MKIINTICAAFALTVILALGAQAAMRASTEEFIQKTAAANQFEIDAAKIAKDKAQNAKVGDFARKMIDDHSKAGEDFMAALKTAGKDSPAPDATPDADQQSALDALNKTSGKDFDAQYVDSQVKAHDQTVDLFQDYVKNGDNKALQDFAQRTLPTLEQHQKMIKDIKGGM
jgi:putative membrane protein